jgi:hypothetical protein
MLGVATDHVIESFRNRLWADYKTGAGIEPALLAQFHPLDKALTAMGVVVWPMIELSSSREVISSDSLLPALAECLGQHVPTKATIELNSSHASNENSTVQQISLRLRRHLVAIQEAHNSPSSLHGLLHL